MPHVTFLSAKRALCKVFTADAVTPYPLAKTFTSYSDSVDSTEELYHSINTHALQGHCLYKGSFSEPLSNESRRGKTSKLEKSELFVLDVDGFEVGDTALPAIITEEFLAYLGESIIQKLPVNFKDASYVLQASASLGRKGNKISLHFFFLLSNPMTPGEQKDILTGLNFTDNFKHGLSLSTTGKSLKYPVDICMAQNTRIIYIAPPIFKDMEDTIEQRIVLVSKEHDKLSIKNLLEENTGALNKDRAADVIKTLRRDMGLNKQVAQVKPTFDLEGERVELLLNPDPCRIELSYRNGDFVYFNLNSGDSNAYFTKVKDPYIVFNFKGEPAFKMVDVDPEFYSWFLEEYKQEVDDTTEFTPFVFDDYISARCYRGIWNPKTSDIVSLNACKNSDLENFMVYKNALMPDPLPVWNYSFNPHSFKGVDPENEFVNMFEPTPYLKSTDVLEEDIGYFNGNSKLEEHCPWIYMTIAHMLNYSEPEILHFINWLVFVLKIRDKTKTAWIISGTTGTGKGNLFAKIMFPLLGKHAFMGKMRQLEDNFNAWLRHTLFLVVDEFNLKDSKSASHIENFIKNMITEPYTVPRAMHKDPEQIRNYTSLLLYSNQHDMMRIPENDRRFSIGPRQETPIIELHKNIDEICNEFIPKELGTFMKFVNAYQVDKLQAARPLMNTAKADLQDATETTPEEFAKALRNGNLDYFIQNILEIEPIGTFDDNLLDAAKLIVKNLIMQCGEDQPGIFTSDLAVLYSAANGDGRMHKPAKVTAMLGHHGIARPKNVRIYGKQKKGINIAFQLHDYDRTQLIGQYFTKSDRGYPGTPTITSIKEGES